MIYASETVRGKGCFQPGAEKQQQGGGCTPDYSKAGVIQCSCYTQKDPLRVAFLLFSCLGTKMHLNTCQIAVSVSEVMTHRPCLCVCERCDSCTGKWSRHLQNCPRETDRFMHRSECGGSAGLCRSNAALLAWYDDQKPAGGRVWRRGASKPTQKRPDVYTKWAP